MLENVAAWVLNNFIGEYLENLNTDQLSVAILSGQLELDNVPFKKTALRKLDLPFEIKAGLLGKLALSIPLTRFRSEPSILKLSDVLIIVGPLSSEHKYDVEVVEQLEQQKKQQLLEELEKHHMELLLNLLGRNIEMSQDQYWGASILSSIINNVQLILNNVHIRYEDSRSLPDGKAFNCGFRLQKLSMQTTNSHWKPGFIESQDGVNNFKKLEISGFSVYWNSDAEMSDNSMSPAILRNKLAPENPLDSYIIHPCSWELRMEKNTSKFPLKGKIPRFKFFLAPQKIIVELSKRQLAELRALMREWGRFERARRHRKWRPKEPVKGNADKWWRFAVSRVLDDWVQSSATRTWTYAQARAHHLNAYCRAYKRRLLVLMEDDTQGTPTNEAAGGRKPFGSAEDIAIMQQIERDAKYTYHELFTFREMVFRRLMNEKEKQLGGGKAEGSAATSAEKTPDEFENIDSTTEDIPSKDTGQPQQAPSGGLYSWITGFFTSAVEEEEDKAAELAAKFDLPDLSEISKTLNVKEVEEELLDVLHESWDDSTLLRRDSLLAEIALRMDSLTLRFLDTIDVVGVEQSRVLAMHLDNVLSRVEMSPRRHDTAVSLTVSDLTIQRLIQQSKTPTGLSDLDDDSLVYSTSDLTRILLTVGRQESDYGGLINEGKSPPLISMHYRRRSPALLISHRIECTIRPLSLMYDEGAFEGFSEFFSESLPDASGTSTSEIIESHVFANFSVPDVIIEMRGYPKGLLNAEIGQPIACLHLQELLLRIANQERYISQLNLEIGHIDLLDRLENTNSILFSSSDPKWPTEITKDEASREISCSMTVVDPRHVAFESKFASRKINILIDSRKILLNMNRRSWTALMDMMGLLGRDSEVIAQVKMRNATTAAMTQADDVPTLSQQSSSLIAAVPYYIHTEIRSQQCRLAMQNNSEETQLLGNILFGNITLETTTMFNQRSDTFSLEMRMQRAEMTDEAPMYSSKYAQRLLLDTERKEQPEEIQFSIVKYMNGSAADKPFELSIEMNVPKTTSLHYVHTQRYFMSFVNYWMHFLELQDHVTKTREQKFEQAYETGSRVCVHVNIDGPTSLVLPLAYNSDHILLCRTDGLQMSNVFKRLTRLKDFFESHSVETDFGYDANIDCLIDALKFTLRNVHLHEAIRVDAKENPSIGESEMLALPGVFSSFNLVASRDELFDRAFDLPVEMFRNLDTASSHNVPDVTIITQLQGLRWRVSTHGYMLLRGFLEKNLGEWAPPQPEAIPIEVLEKPHIGCEVENDRKYATLSFRLLFEKVELDCILPTNIHSVSYSGPWKPFALMSLVQARISFDCFIDGQSELDLICEQTEIKDKRILATKNLYPNVLQQRQDMPSETDTRLSLMLEVHVMMRSEGPPLVTVVLVNSSLLILYDWLDIAKQFVLLTPDWYPNFYLDNQPRTRNLSSIHSRVEETYNQAHKQTFTMKITLRNCDLFIVEDVTRSDALALICKVTAVVNANDAGGRVSGNLEVQAVALSWCSMSNAVSSRNECSNEFMMTVSLEVDHPKNAVKGLPIVQKLKHIAVIELDKAVGRVSYRDVRIFSAILDGFQNYLHSLPPDLSILPYETRLDTQPFIDLGTVTVKFEQANVWLLDDFDENSIPLARFSASRVVVVWTERLVASFTVSIDYFNHRVFGWEPLIENWAVLRLMSFVKDNTRNIEIITETQSTLDINLTEQFVQQAIQFADRWPSVRETIERDGLRSTVLRTRSDQLPYLLRNETGSDLSFTTEVNDLLSARAGHRKYSVRWISVPAGEEKMFQFPVRLLDMLEADDPWRQLIIRVAGWDEASPVAVDSCGAYFRIIKATQDGLSNARLVIRVTMDKLGKKIVSIQSSISISNQLPDTVAVCTKTSELLQIEPASTRPVPLRHVNMPLVLYPLSTPKVVESVTIDWREVRGAGDVMNYVHVLETEKRAGTAHHYWACTAIKRESYPEEETEPLPGHTIHVATPVQIQNLLPLDAELSINDSVVAIGAGKQLLLTSVDVMKEIKLQVSTDRLTSMCPIRFHKSQIGEGQLKHIRMIDAAERPLDVYANIQLLTAGAISISLWTPFWIVNKAGIPLVISQEAAPAAAAGQMDEHERARDRHPLMFSFADDGCPKQCVLRVGSKFIPEEGYVPSYSNRFALAPGVQALKLKIEHITMPTIYYNIGVEVRAGTGRYKDTQVVLLTARFSLSNLSSVSLTLSHADLIERPSEHVVISPQSTRVWNENYEQRRLLCVKRVDTKHWSCPFPIDRIGSFHVTMRDSDETPRFVRVEIILAGAVFCVSFTDAHFYPPPIRIENLSDVPVLYQQYSDTPTKQHLRTICKARSHVDYAWDDLYGEKRILLQVFENKFHCYDPCVVGNGQSLQYENYVFIQLKHSFEKVAKKSSMTEEYELVLETLDKGKVILNKQHRIDGNSGNQLWRLCSDGCIENIGMNARSKTRMVLDVMDKAGRHLMMLPRINSRDKTQHWTIMPDGRMCCQSNPLLFTTAKRTEVSLEEGDKQSQLNEDGVSINQCWKIERQRPGSGTLDVECLHNGPTKVLRITDREEHSKRLADMQMQSSSKDAKEFGYTLSVTMRNGIGVSIVNSLSEELLYGRLSGISLFASFRNNYQLTASVDTIQVDNQLLSANKWQVLSCQAESVDDELNPLAGLSPSELPAGVSATQRPALKIEFNVTPRDYYYSFDCFLMKLCELSLHIDEVLLWKLVHFAQSSNASASMQHKSLSLPPNTELQRHDPLKTRRCYFGTLSLEMGQISLSVSTVPKTVLSVPLRQLKQQFNIKLVSFENALVLLPPFRQFNYFETSSFLLESLRNFYFSELQKQTLKVIMTLDAFGNPQGFVTDLKDSFQGLFIEGDVSRFVAGLGYGVSNSISKFASSVSSGVGSFTFDEEHEAKRRHNLARSQSSASTPLTHLYSGVKGLGMGLFGGVTAIPTNVFNELKKNSNILGGVKGLTTGAVDTVTKPVQGILDLVEGTASAIKQVSAPSTTRHNSAITRIRPPRLCRDLHCLLPPYSIHLASAQQELLRINAFSTKERLLDVEVCLEQFASIDQMIRQYVLISTKQCYVCKQSMSPSQTSPEPSSVIQRIAYKYLKCVQASPELPNTLASVEVQVETDENRVRLVHIWCMRGDVARRLADKIQRAKQEYDHSKRAVKDLDSESQNNQ